MADPQKRKKPNWPSYPSVSPVESHARRVSVAVPIVLVAATATIIISAYSCQSTTGSGSGTYGGWFFPHSSSFGRAFSGSSSPSGTIRGGFGSHVGSFSG